MVAFSSCGYIVGEPTCLNIGEPLWQSFDNEPWQERWVNQMDGKLLEEYEWEHHQLSGCARICCFCCKSCCANLFPPQLLKFRGLPPGAKPLTTKLEQDELLGQLQGQWKIIRFPDNIYLSKHPKYVFPILFEAGFTDVSIVQDRMLLSGGFHKETVYTTPDIPMFCTDRLEYQRHRKTAIIDVTNGKKKLRIIPFRGPDETFYLDNIGTKIVRISKDKGEIEIDNAMGNKGLLQRPWKHHGGVPPNPPPPNKSDYPRANMTMNDRGDAAAKEGRKESNNKGIPSKGKKKTRKKTKKKKKKKENTIVDEIRELHKLKEQGILTEEEFQQAKTAVITKSSAASAANDGTNTNPTAGEHVPANQNNPQQATQQQQGSSAGNNPPPYNPSYQYNPYTNAGGNSK